VLLALPEGQQVQPVPYHPEVLRVLQVLGLQPLPGLLAVLLNQVVLQDQGSHPSLGLPVVLHFLVVLVVLRVLKVLVLLVIQCHLVHQQVQGIPRVQQVLVALVLQVLQVHHLLQQVLAVLLVQVNH
jgi:hypothetical protein